MAITTIRDVAEYTSVGVGTFSRVLNNHPFVSDATRQKVLDAIAELDYTPNSIARCLSLRKTLTIAVIVPFFTRPAHVEQLRGVEQVLAIANTIWLYSTSSSSLACPKIWQRLRWWMEPAIFAFIGTLSCRYQSRSLVTVAILQLSIRWGDFLWPLMVTRAADFRPLPVAIQQFLSQDPKVWGDIMAFAAMTTIPVLIVFLLFQKWFVQSVATTGVKGWRPE